MRLPRSRIGGWAREIITMCSTSMMDRVQRGAVFKNLYLTGDEQGNPATYPKTFAFVDNLSSYLYSPVELRWGVEFYGASSELDNAKARVVSTELLKYARNSGLDTKIEEAVTWSLVKGKSFVKTLWTSNGTKPHLIQPEMMGVLREDITALDDQEAFFHRMYLTPYQFRRLLEDHPDRTELMRKAAKYTNAGVAGYRPDQDGNQMKQVILGGMYPFQSSGGQQKANRGVVEWLAAPAAKFAPDVLTKLIAMDELWVWDDETRDWTTIQIVGDDCVLEGADVHRNIFSFDAYTDPDERKNDEDNPLKGQHPFNEFCANPLDGYFWGLSEIQHVALLQKSLNSRLDGINKMLRLQENPPKLIIGSTSINQNAMAKLSKPGGFLADGNPNTKMQDVAPKVPEDLYVAVHEIEQMYDDMAGFAPVLQGRGESGVRAQGHAETLVRTASPRFKDRALTIERQVECLGGLMLNILQAHVPNKLLAWVAPKAGGAEAVMTEQNPAWMAPVEGMKAVEFSFHDFPDNAKIVVDSHSSSPAFSHETRELLFTLAKMGAVSGEQLVAHTHPPGEDTLIADIERSKAEKAAYLAQHPEAAQQAQHGKKK